MVANLAIDIKKKILFYETKKSGVGYARDLGISKSSYEFVAFLDSDDIWPLNYLKDRKELMNKSNDQFCCTPYIYYNIQTKKSVEIRPLFHEIKFKHLFLMNWIGNSTVICKKSLIIRSGGYSLLKKRCDYNTWLRLSKLNSCVVHDISKPVLITRRNNSLSSNKINLIYYQFLCFKNVPFNFVLALMLSTISIFFTNIFKIYNLLIINKIFY